MRLLSFFSILALCLLVSCSQEEQIADAPSEPVAIETGADWQQAIPASYEKAGFAFREAIDYLVSSGQVESFNVSDIPDLDEQYADFTNYLSQMSAIGYLSTLDVEMVNRLLVFLENMPLDTESKFSDAHQLLDDFKTQHDISVRTTPLTYHTLEIAREAIFETDVSKLAALSLARGTNDGALCSAPWFCGDVSSIASTVVAGIAVSYFRDEANWSAAQEGAVGAAISIGISLAFRGLCALLIDCDNCAPAVGIAQLTGNCGSFNGIRAVGNFEFAERWNWSIDDNQDGAYETTFFTLSSGAGGTLSPSLLSSSGVNINSPFNAIVDVFCDGNTPMPWPVDDATSVTVNPSTVSTPSPTGIVNGPPSQSGYLYPVNTQLCFNLQSLNLNGNTFLGWQATGGNPSTGSATSTFCTTFTQAPISRSVIARFMDPCTGQIRILSKSFVIIN